MIPCQSDKLKDPTQVELRVRAEKLKLLFHQSFPAAFISLLTALLYTWASWDLADRTTLLAWLALLSLSTFSRIGVFLAYFRAEPKEQNMLRWEKPYITTLLLSSLIWGFGTLAALSPASTLHQAFTLFVLIGMAGGAISTYSALRTMALGAMLAVLLPSTVWLYLQGGKLQMAMALGAAIFILGSLRSTCVLTTAMHRSLRLTEELRYAHEDAERQAQTDALTGANNRRAFFDFGQQLASYCRRTGRPLCALLIDIDHFKNINDTHGHSAGDAALRQVSDILRGAVRESDIFGRLGGEEFALLLPDTSPAEAATVAEKLRTAVAVAAVQLHDAPVALTVSIGVASGSYDVETLLHHADTAMYRAKAEGRNRVVNMEPPQAGAMPAELAIRPA